VECKVRYTLAMTQLIQRIAVKAVVVNDLNQVLLLRKSNDDTRHAGKSGRYNLPGGKIDAGEEIQVALRREVYEETGLAVQVQASHPILVGEWRPIVRGVPHQIIGMFFVCTDWTGTVKLDSEHQGFVWADQDTVSTLDILSPDREAALAYFDTM
jgi:8-oxo-dGTP diphosphatase